jgi:hypothetical protein
MKNLLLIVAGILFPLIAVAQNPAVEKLFQKYQGQEGFTTVLITQDAFKVLSEMENQEGKLEKPLDKIREMKVLAQDDEAEISGLNFYDELKKDMNFSEYKELIVVKEKDQDVRVVARENGGRLSELLVIVGGKDNVLVWIAGDFTFEELGNLSNLGGIDQLKVLKQL